MPKSNTRKKKTPKRVLALPGQRTYEHAIREFVAWAVNDRLGIEHKARHFTSWQP